MSYTFRNIQQLLHAAHCVQAPAPNNPIDLLLLDSRQVRDALHTLFFAVKGPQHDGHRFVGACYEAGIRNFIVEEAINWSAFPEANVLEVESSIHALQIIAGEHRHRFQLPVIGITGSNGKTIVKEWLYQLLRSDYNIVRSPRSYNSQSGVPLSLWLIEPEHELGIFEAGVSQSGEMTRLAPLIKCQLGVFTNIGEAHSLGFESTTQKIQEKLTLFEYANTIVYCADQEESSKQLKLKYAEKQLLSWSEEGRKADIQIKLTTHSKTESLFQVTHKDLHFELRIPFSDQASQENALHCLAVLLHLNVKPDLIRARFADIEPVAMRLEMKMGLRGCTLINDTYNSDPDSLRIALQFLEQQRPYGSRTLILSDMLQSRDTPSDLYARLASSIKAHSINRFIGIGSEIEAIQPYLDANTKSMFFSSTANFLENIANIEPLENETILVKGARSFALEQIVERLEWSAHKTVLEIDLNALQNNLKVFRRLIKPEVQLLLMVKASAYGAGADEVARMLEFQHADYLGVAYIDEGVALRNAGIRTPVLVLNPERAGFNDLFEHKLEPEVYSLNLLTELLLAKPPGTILPIHLKLETGMNRLGFEEQDIPALLKRLQELKDIRVRSVFSHLASSEDPASDAFTKAQVRRFEQQYEQLATGLGYRPWRHILNTEGIHRFPQFQYEMVRLGIGFYGISNDVNLQPQLQEAMRLKSKISQIKTLKPGETVGYGQKGVLAKGGRIATISVGYADGLLRAAGNGHHTLLIHHQLAPIVGNVCMDMCMVDITHIPEAREGDEAIVFGPEHSVLQLAASLNTIPYEVFTNIGARVKRVYLQE